MIEWYHMGKNILIMILAAAVGALVYFNYTPRTATHTPQTATTTDAKVCAQIITSARNPTTAVIKEFPTPCDVPKGWELIENDVPSLDLQVQ
jgi:hypothetical protein